MPRPGLLAIVVPCLALLCGCATHITRLEPMRAAFHRGDLDEAERLIAADLEKHPGDADVLTLDQALVALADGRPIEAEDLLKEVRDRFDHLEQESPAEDAWSMLSDDQQRSYAGEDHEKVLLRAMLAITNLSSDGGDAEAFSYQAAEKQAEIVAAATAEDGTNPKASYRQIALAPYLRGVLREETHRDYDDAARHFATVVNWQPEFAAGQADVVRATGGVHSPHGHGVVHVFALVGHGPCKVVVEEIPSSAALLVADQILSATLTQSLPPTVAPIKVPRVVAAPGLVSAVAVGRTSPGGGVAWQGRTTTITDISRMAVEQEAAVHDRTVARAVARRALKKGTVFGVKEGLGVERFGPAALAFDLAGVAWEAAENADTRCWGLLPDSIQVVRMELPAGQHTLALQAVDRQGMSVGRAVPRSVTVTDGRNTYVVVTAVDAGILGKSVESVDKTTSGATP
jgi:tetratricopeptide (TPR) repeat protein